MRTLGRRLKVPQVAEAPAGTETYSLGLPRRRTRRLFTAFAIVLGVGAGLAYSRFFLDEPQVLTTVAVACVGAILGFVLVLMPGVLLQFVRKSWCRVVLARRRVALRALLERARRKLGELLEESPEDADTWNDLGVVEHLRGDEQRAAHCLEKACSLDRDSFQTNLAAALAEVREFDRAAEILMAARQREADAQVAHHNLGVLLARRPPAEVVDRVVQEVAGLGEPAILNSLGVYELSSGRLDLAEEYFARASEADPISAAPKANLAIVVHRRGRGREAMRKLADAVYLDPLNPAMLNDLGALMCAAGQPLPAAEQLTRASFLSPGSAAVELNRGSVHIALGHFAEALDCFNHPAARAEYGAEAAHNACLALVGLNQYEEARAQAAAALEQGGADADVHTNLGCVAWALDDLPTMERQLRRAAELAASSLAAAKNLAIADLTVGKEAESIERLEALRSRNPSDLGVAFHLGLAYLADSLKLYRPEMATRERQDFFRALHRCTRQ
jgi:Flp pilus assembly protein TadD